MYVLRQSLIFTIVTIVFLSWSLVFGKSFVLWGQIEEVSEILEISAFKAHTIRIVLINGIILAIQYFMEFEREHAFNISVYIILFISTLIFVKEVYLSLTDEILLAVLLSFIPLVIAYFQNGRGVFAGFAVLLLYSLSHFKSILSKWLGFCIALIFSNVSSGVFSVLLITILIGTLNRTFAFIRLGHLILLLLFLSPLFVIYLDKNLSYYNYSFYSLLSHGLGFIFHYNLAVLIPLLFVLALFLLLFVYYGFYLNPKILYSRSFPFIAASFVGLLFGFTSFTCFVYVHILILLKGFLANEKK